MAVALTDASSYAAMLAALATVLGALGGVVKLVLNAMSEQDARHDENIRTYQERQEKFLGNHMSGNTRALERVANQLEALNAEAERAHRHADENERDRRYR